MCDCHSERRDKDLLIPSELHGIAMWKNWCMCCDRKARAACAQELKFWEIKHRVWITIISKLLQTDRATVEHDDVIETKTKNCLRSQIAHAMPLPYRHSIQSLMADGLWPARPVSFKTDLKPFETETRKNGSRAVVCLRGGK